jgi:hypothetical protein
MHFSAHEAPGEHPSLETLSQAFSQLASLRASSTSQVTVPRRSWPACRPCRVPCTNPSRPGSRQGERRPRCGSPAAAPRPADQPRSASGSRRNGDRMGRAGTRTRIGGDRPGCGTASASQDTSPGCQLSLELLVVCQPGSSEPLVKVLAGEEADQHLGVGR